jgi:hypothetical protein
MIVGGNSTRLENFCKTESTSGWARNAPPRVIKDKALHPVPLCIPSLACHLADGYTPEREPL